MKDINVKNVVEFLAKSNTETNALVRLADISSELGEVSKEVLKASDYGRDTPILKDNTSFKEEYGDLLFAILALGVCRDITFRYPLANLLFAILALGVENDVDPSEALELVLNKYNTRLEKKGHIGSGN